MTRRFALGLCVVWCFLGVVYFLRSTRNDISPNSEVQRLNQEIPDVVLERHTGDPIALADVLGDGLIVMFITSINDCIVCQAEVALWRDFDRQFPELNLVPIGVGGDRHAYKAIGLDLDLPRDFLFDDNHALLRKLGLPPSTPSRVLAHDGRIVGVSQARTGDSMYSFIRSLA